MHVFLCYIYIERESAGCRRCGGRSVSVYPCEQFAQSRGRNKNLHCAWGTGSAIKDGWCWRTYRSIIPFFLSPTTHNQHPRNLPFISGIMDRSRDNVAALRGWASDSFWTWVHSRVARKPQWRKALVATVVRADLLSSAIWDYKEP